MTPWLTDRLLGGQSDERLVELARAGDSRAFAMIVERYRRQLYALARRLDRDHAEDIVQQALLSAFTALRAGAEVRHLRGWLHQIVRNAAIRGAVPSPVELAIDTAGGELVEDALDRRMLALGALNEIARLPGRQRDALVQTALNGRSRAEVATEMGVSEGAVRQLVHRARTSLRSAVRVLIPYPAAAGAASSTGGVAVKLGAIAATCVVAGGAVVLPSALDHVARAPGHRAARSASQRSAQPVSRHVGGVDPVVVPRAAVVARVGRLHVAQPRPAAAQPRRAAAQVTKPVIERHGGERAVSSGSGGDRGESSSGPGPSVAPQPVTSSDGTDGGQSGGGTTTTSGGGTTTTSGGGTTTTSDGGGDMSSTSSDGGLGGSTDGGTSGGSSGGGTIPSD